MRRGGSPARRQVAPEPLYRDPPFDAPTDPVLCFNAEQKKWLMYYTARRATAPNTPGVTWVHGSNIGMAESSDGGATWTYRGTADIRYGKDSHPNDYTYWAPEVIWHDGTYHMFLSYVPGIFTDWNHPREIVHLTSKDGLKWDTAGPVDLKSDRVIDACVIQLPDGTWRMWYKDERKPKSLSYADSPGPVPLGSQGQCRDRSQRRRAEGDSLEGKVLAHRRHVGHRDARVEFERLPALDTAGGDPDRLSRRRRDQRRPRVVVLLWRPCAGRNAQAHAATHHGDQRRGTLGGRGQTDRGRPESAGLHRPQADEGGGEVGST